MTWKEIEARRIPEIAWIMMAVSLEARQTVKKQMLAGQEYDSPQTGEEGLMLLFFIINNKCKRRI